jgi:ribonuclease VapC
MVIDTSALMAILLREPEAERLTHAILMAERRLLSAATLLEAGIVVLAHTGDDGARDLDLLVARLRLEIVPVTEEQAMLARRAYQRFGKGRGHPARLNFGDCFSFALARVTGEPLLFKGDDFSRVGLTMALY